MKITRVGFVLELSIHSLIILNPLFKNMTQLLIIPIGMLLEAFRVQLEEEKLKRFNSIGKFPCKACTFNS
jgi:hypothetical protein